MTETRRRSALGASAIPLVAGEPLVRRSVPHSPQNFTPGAFEAPQLGHDPANGVPHSPQNFLSSSFAVPQAWQFTRVSDMGAASIRGGATAVNHGTLDG
jgi:hypothetical protein